jgi:hypothetical protein
LHAKGGQFVTHVKVMPGTPHDSHTLATVIPEMEALIGYTIERVIADKKGIAATTRHPITSSGASPPARSGAWPPPATTSTSSSDGGGFYCTRCSAPSRPASDQSNLKSKFFTSDWFISSL